MSANVATARKALNGETGDVNRRDIIARFV